MRVFGQLAFVCVAATVWMHAQDRQAGPPAAAPPSQASIDAAAKVLAEARQALGGDAKLSAVKNFVATGRTRRVTGDNLVPIEFEINVELPDKYVRKDEIPAQETAPSSSGFNGDALIQIPPPAAPPTGPPAAAGGRAAAPPAAAPEAGGRTPPPPGAAGGAPAAAPAGADAARAGGRGPAGAPAGAARPAADPRAARVLAIKQDFVRLTLGMFATSFSSYPLTFAFVGQAEAPQGKADVIDARGPGNFAVRLFIDDQTHLPVMISWQTPPTPANIVLLPAGQTQPATLPPGAIVVPVPAAPAAAATQEEKDKYTKDVAAIRAKTMAEKKIENRIYYADYRDSDGVKFPYRLRRGIGVDTVEETTFDRFKLNTKIDPKKFEPVK